MESKVDRRKKLMANAMDVRDSLRLIRQYLVEEDFNKPSERLKLAIDETITSISKMKQIIDDI